MRRLPMFDALLKAGFASAVMVLAPPAAAVSATTAAATPPQGTYTVAPDVEGAVPLADAATLESLVAPVALYPDDLLSIVLPASTYPLQIVQAARFLDELERDPDLKPPADWDDAVVALLNYPEVVRMMDADLDWTWKLGEAVLNQEEDVVTAVAGFRTKAHEAGNLKTDQRQIVEVTNDVVEIRPADPQVIYVPYYEPARMIVYQSAPAYYYYPRPRPVYYYPYPADYGFASGYFWGVSSAYAIGWSSHNVYMHNHHHHRHPYYGHTYHNRHHYRHDRHYDYRHNRGHYDNHYNGRGNDDHASGGRPHQSAPNHWRPNEHRAGARPGSQTRSAMHPRSGNSRNSDGGRNRGGQTLAAGRVIDGRAAPSDPRGGQPESQQRRNNNPFARGERSQARASGNPGAMALASSTAQDPPIDRVRGQSRPRQADWMGKLDATGSQRSGNRARDRGAQPQSTTRAQTERRGQSAQRAPEQRRTQTVPRERERKSMNQTPASIERRTHERTASVLRERPTAAPRMQAPPRSTQPRREQPQMRAPQQNRQEQRVARTESAPRARGQQHAQRQSSGRGDNRGGSHGGNRGGGRESHSDY